MVFFKDAIEHITRAARVFRQPGGHMIMVSDNKILIPKQFSIILVSNLLTMIVRDEGCSRNVSCALN